MAYEKGTPEERFWRKVMPEPMSGCWLWTGYSVPLGYGQFWDGSRHSTAHRFSYELHKGPVPAGLYIDHKCSNPYCCNPDHLDAVTQSENMLRASARGRLNNQNTGRVVCHRGHALTPENTFVRQDGRRRCRTCMRALGREADARRRAKAKAA